MKRFLILLAVLGALLFSAIALAQTVLPSSDPLWTMSEFYNNPAKLKYFLSKEYPKTTLELQLRAQHDLQDLLVKYPKKDDKEREHLVRTVTRLAFKSADQESFRRLMSVIKPRLSSDDQETLMDEVLKLTLKQGREGSVSEGAPSTEQFGLVPPATKVDGLWSGSISTGVYSQYWAPAAGFAIHSKPVAQTEFDAIYTKGNREIGLLLWNSQGLHKQGWGSGGEEWDAGGYVAWTFRGNRRLEVRDWHFFLGGEVRSDLNNPSVKYSRMHELGPGFSVTVFSKADGYIPTNRKGPDAGAIIAGGGTIEKNLAHGFSASVTVQAAIDPFGTFGFRKNAVIYRQDYGVKYTHGSWNLAPTLTFGGANDDERPGKITASLVLTRNFSFGKH